MLGVRLDGGPYRNLTHFHLNCRIPRQRSEPIRSSRLCKLSVPKHLESAPFVQGWHPPCNPRSRPESRMRFTTVANPIGCRE